MKIITFRRNSIAFRLTVIFIAAAFAQCAVMFAMLVKGGVISKTRENTYTYFSSQVESRKANLESQMKNVWTNFGDYPKQITQQFDIYRNRELSKEDQEQAALKASAPYLLEVLNTTKTTGVFLILDDEKENPNQHSAIYIRNTDVDKAGPGNFTLTLMSGPIDIAREYEFSTNENWSWNLQLNDENNAFYEKAYQNVGLNEDRELLCYWSPPFTLTNDNEKILTYSIPMTDAKGEPIGVFGIEISVNHLYKFLPKNDLSSDSTLGYIIGMRTEENGPVFPVVARGAVQEKLLHLAEPLALSEENKELDICEIENVNSSEKIYSSIKKMGIYYNNTPFSNEEWYLIGLMQGSELLKFVDNIFRVTFFSMLITVLFGIIIAVFSSRHFSRPIARLANEVRNLSQKEPNKERLTNTGLAEIDELAEAIMITQKKMSELNEKLKHERDRDPLTDIRNRHAFNFEIEHYNRHKDSYEIIGMGIFDLNGLKYVNDNFGHEEGDNYLCETASAISRSFGECPVFRIGGDEFAIIFVNITREALEHKYSMLCSIIEEKNKNKSFKGGVAFGYAFFQPDEDSGLEQVLKRADRCMYERKKIMKNLNA